MNTIGLTNVVGVEEPQHCPQKIRSAQELRCTEV